MKLQTQKRVMGAVDQIMARLGRAMGLKGYDDVMQVTLKAVKKAGPGKELLRNTILRYGGYVCDRIKRFVAAGIGTKEAQRRIALQNGESLRIIQRIWAESQMNAKTDRGSHRPEPESPTVADSRTTTNGKDFSPRSHRSHNLRSRVERESF